MKKNILRYLFCTSAFIFALCCVHPVFAHGGEPRIEISSERLNPGGMLQIRGVDFEYETEVTIVLVNSTSHMIVVSLGTITTDIEGGFTQNITLPVDLPEGNYAFRAKTYDHEIFSPPFIVWGTAVVDQESNIIVDQSDIQFGSVPTFAPSVVPNTALSQPTIQSPQSSVNIGSTSTLPILIVLLGVGILIVLSARKMRQRK